jgi:hypothetical protein
MNEPEKKIRCKMDENNVVVFKTLPGQQYLITPKGKEEKPGQTVYESSPNQAPKTFYEAVLGKSRNF